MYRCELCHEWIHTLCIPKRSDLCAKCTRSRRPALQSVIPLLVELQEQKLHITEGDSLQALIERVVRWRSDYKMILQRIKCTNTNDQDDSTSKTMNEELLSETIALYVESLLFEVQLDESAELAAEMKQCWPQFGELEPPEGSELAPEGKIQPNVKDKRKREVKVSH